MTPEEKRSQHGGRRCRDTHAGVTHISWAARTPGVLDAMKAAKPNLVAEPEPPPMTVAQVSAIAHVLARHGVEYILIGGMGGQIQGVPVGVTRDVDFTARQTEKNLERVVNALRDLGARVRIEGDSPHDVPLTKEFLAGMVSVQMVTDHGPMDINF